MPIDPPTLAVLQSSIVLVGTLSASVTATLLTQRGQRKLEEVRAAQASRDKRRERLRDVYSAAIVGASDIHRAIYGRAYRVDPGGNIILDPEKDATLHAELTSFLQDVSKHRIALILDDPDAVTIIDRYVVYVVAMSDPHMAIPPSERPSRESGEAFLKGQHELLTQTVNELIARAKTRLDELDRPMFLVTQRSRTWHVRLPFQKAKTQT